MNLTQLVLLLLIGGIGGYIGSRLKLPAGFLIGSMLAVGACKYFSIITLESSGTLSFIVQLALGLLLGVTFSKIDMNEMKKLAGALLIITLGVIVMTFGVGYGLSFFTNIDLKTIFLATAPGGIAEMSTIAQALHLNSPVVAILHVMRLLIVLAIFPMILRIFYKKLHPTIKRPVEKGEINENKSLG